MLFTANLANYETLPCGKILCILHRQCGCRWPGSLNFLTERAHVFQYVCVFNQSKVPQFLSHARGCLFVIPERKLFFWASPCSCDNCAHQFLRKHPNPRLEDSRVPQFAVHKTSTLETNPDPDFLIQGILIQFWVGRWQQGYTGMLYVNNITYHDMEVSWNRGTPFHHAY